MTAKIGTPRMKAAKLRCSCATAHTASREPNSGKLRYAGSLFAASCASAGSSDRRTTAASSRSRRWALRRAVGTRSEPRENVWETLLRDELVPEFTQRSRVLFMANAPNCQAKTGVEV